MIERIVLLLQQLEGSDIQDLKQKWLSDSLSNEAKKIDEILSRLPKDQVIEVFSSFNNAAEGSQQIDEATE